MIAEKVLESLGLAIGDSHPHVSQFEGEVHIEWKSGAKHVVLMVFPTRSALLYYYMPHANAPSEHGIVEATAKEVSSWLKWIQE